MAKTNDVPAFDVVVARRAIRSPARDLLDERAGRGVTLRDVTHARPIKARRPVFAIAALCLALLGLTLPRFGGPVDRNAVFARGVGAAHAANAAEAADLAGVSSTSDPDEGRAGDQAAFAAPIASAIDVAAVLQREAESLQRPDLELRWAKARALPAYVRSAAMRCLVVGDPVRVSEREVAAHACPLLRWRLAHSTSSAIG